MVLLHLVSFNRKQFLAMHFATLTGSILEMISSLSFLVRIISSTAKMDILLENKQLFSINSVKLCHDLHKQWAYFYDCFVFESSSQGIVLRVFAMRKISHKQTRLPMGTTKLLSLSQTKIGKHISQLHAEV